MLRRLHGHLSPPPPAAAAAAASERTEASPAAPATPGLSAAQLAAYERDGFLTLPSVLAPAELVALREESERIIDGFPTEPGGTQDRHGRTPICQPAFGPVLGDPMAQRTDPNRHSGVKLSTYTPREAESVQVPYKIGGWLAYSHPFRQLYGHPVLCAAAESVYGPDFVPFNESMVIKRGEVAPAISWHQDGGTHWDDPQPEHGFNFMVNLWDCDEENALWVVRGSHRMGKLDVPALQAEHGERLEGCGALPLLARAGDVTLVNRNCVSRSIEASYTTQRVRQRASWVRRLGCMRAGVSSHRSSWRTNELTRCCCCCCCCCCVSPAS